MNTNIDYRIIYKDEKVIGLIGQDSNGTVKVNANDELCDKILKGLISPVKIDETDRIGDIEISKSRIITPDSKEWLGLMEYGLPYNFYASPVRQITEKTFKDINLNGVKSV